VTVHLSFWSACRAILTTRTLLTIGKYVLAVGLLAWVVKANWAPPPTRASAALAASTAGLCAAPAGHGPLLAASAAVPGRLDSHGLGYVYQRHVVNRQPIHAGYLAAGFTVYCLAAGLTMVRWYLLVRALDLSITLRDAFRFGLIGIFFNTFLPGAVGGDIIKAAVLARGQKRRTAAAATVIMDRLLALWALVWFVAILGSLFWGLGLLVGSAAVASSSIVIGALVVVGGTATGWMLIGLVPDSSAETFASRLTRLPLVGTSAAELMRAAWLYRRKQGTVAAVLALTWVGQAGFVTSFYCCTSALWTAALGPVPSLSQHFLLVPIGLVMQVLVPTPGGAGGGEWSFAALYRLFGAAEASGVLGSLLQRVLIWTLGLLGCLVYLGTKSELAAGQGFARPFRAERAERPSAQDGTAVPSPAPRMAGKQTEDHACRAASTGS
jgi:uncharacterized membrane protein YbhN (UPF0104 family)